MAKSKKKKKKKGINKLATFILLLSFALMAGCFARQELQPQPKESDGIELAIPSLAADVESQVIGHIGYTVSYNSTLRNPNWVAYELTAMETEGEESRNNRFIPDPDINGTQAEDGDYKRSGWDRGHLAPAADMKWSRQAMEESFYFSNISPQNNNLNRGVWKYIEELTRDNAKRYEKVLVVTGPVFKSAKGKGCIGKNRVVIPDAFYKVLLVNDNGYKGIGFYCENKAGKKKLKTYARSIDEIEGMTGIDFFQKLPDDIEDTVEKEFNWDDWKTGSRK